MQTPLLANSKGLWARLPKIPRPSRGMVIFMSSVSLVGLALYSDKYRSESERTRIYAAAKALADEPMQSHERPIKLAIYITRPEGHDNMHRSRHWFRKYIKPVLDSAAFDYDLVEGTHPGVIAQHIQRTLVDKNRKLQQQQTPEARYHAMLTASPLDDLTNLLQREQYDGYIAIGRKPFEELCTAYDNTVNELSSSSIISSDNASLTFASSTSGSVPVSSPSLLSRLWSSTISSLRLTSTSSASSPTSTTPLSLDNIALPPIGYLPIVALTGWSTIPIRFYQWFNEHIFISSMGEATLRIVQQQTRPLHDNDLHLGLNDQGNADTEEYEEKAFVVDDEMKEFWKPVNKVENELITAATNKSSASASDPSTLPSNITLSENTAAPLSTTEPKEDANLEQQDIENVNNLVPPNIDERTEKEKRRQKEEEKEQHRKQAAIFWRRYQQPTALQQVLGADARKRMVVFETE